MFEKYRKHYVVRRLITLAAVIISALLQTFVIQTFIRPAELLSGGFTGIALLLERVAEMVGGHFSASVGLLALNIPVAVLCIKSISLRFTFYSMIQVFLASFFLKILHFEALFDDVMLNVIFGGFLYGISVAVALRGNASTGGTDFIALYVSNKTGRSIWGYVFAGNVVILCIFGYLFGWVHAGYSILFQFISTRTVSALHHRYDRVTLQVTTSQAEPVIREYVAHFRHGISCVDAIGGYSHKKMYLLHTVISSYEVNDAVHLMRSVDPHVIINVIRTENFYGGFYRPPIE